MQINHKLWEKRLAKHWPLVYTMAYRKFADADMAEESITYITEKLSRDDWRKLRMYQPKMTFRTYFLTVIANLLIDFHRKKHGRKTLPQWIKKRGVLWTKIYRLLCIKGWSDDDVIELMADENKNPDIVDEIIRLIKEKVTDCGQSPKSGNGHPVNEPVFTPEEKLISKETKAQLAALKLSSQQRLLLKLIYTEGYSVSQAGRMLGLNPDQAHGKHRRLKARIKKELEKNADFNRLRL